MCGRYAMSMNAQVLGDALREQFDLPVNEVSDESREAPSYNISPTNYAATYRTNKQHKAVLQYMSWGLIPFWTKEKKDASQYKTFNARKESIINGSRLWGTVRKHGRCVIPIEGYYEWQHKQVGHSKKVDKIPFFLRRKDRKIMFLAGMFDSVHFKDSDETLKTFTIITGPAPKQTKWLHERMPVVLTPGTDHWNEWLDIDNSDWNDTLSNALSEYQEDDLEWFEVTKDVGKVSNEGEYLIEPVNQKAIGHFFAKLKDKKVKKEDDAAKKEDDEVKREDDEIKMEDPERSRSNQKDKRKNKRHSDESTSSISEHKKPKIEKK